MQILYSTKVLWKHDLLWSNSIFWFFSFYSLTGWWASLSPITIKTYLLPGSVSSIANGLLHLKSVPPRWGLTFSSYPLRLAKIAFTPEDFRKIWVYPWRIGSYPWRIWVYHWRILWKFRLHPQRIPYFFTLPLKKSSIFITYPWRIPWFLKPGGGGADIKCNSPIFFVSQKKKTFWSLYCRTARILTLPENTP